MKIFDSRKFFTFLLVLFSAFFLQGLGGGDDSEQVPLPTKNFQATIIDQVGTNFNVSRLSWTGKNIIKAKYGKSTIQVPFEKIQSIKLIDGDPSSPFILAQIIIKSGNRYQVQLDRLTKVFAETEFGSLEIFVQDISEITF